MRCLGRLTKHHDSMGLGIQWDDILNRQNQDMTYWRNLHRLNASQSPSSIGCVGSWVEKPLYREKIPRETESPLQHAK